MPARIAFPSGWFALHEDGYFLEAKLGPAGHAELIRDLLSGELTDIIGVYHARGGLFTDETDAAVSEVFREWVKSAPTSAPAFLEAHAAADVKRELRRQKTAAEMHADPDAVHDRQREGIAA